MNSSGIHPGRWFALGLLVVLLPRHGFAADHKSGGATVLNPDNFEHYFSDFANDEREMLGTAPLVPWDWFVANIARLDIPDKEMERIYYFRWYACQKHICKARTDIWSASFSTKFRGRGNTT